MDEQNLTPGGEPPRRRRKRSKFQIFKEAYLPYLLLLLAVIVLLFLIIGAVRRSHAQKAANEASNVSQQMANLAAQQSEEVARLLNEAAVLADQYDYEGAIAVLDTFSGDATGFPELTSRRQAYAQASSEMVAWDDPSLVPNLSFQLLIADPSRAFSDETYGEAYNRNYVTTDEFSKILQQLYDNGYMLVRLTDLTETTVNTDGTVSYAPATLYLPAGKKPLVLTQCAVNYFTYMTDGDGDGEPDKDGDGFASRLIVDSSGKILNEMVDAQGNLTTGAFDLVPILEEFIDAHPDFSYRGARAVLALTGYDGIFGYRIDGETLASNGEAYYNEQAEGAKAIVSALRTAGYELACYTYDHIGYGSAENSARIQEDLDNWKQEIAPVLGDVEILVYPFGSDIADYRPSAYSGDNYNVLRGAGFRYFIGMDNNVKSWADVTTDYFRQTRRLVSGAKMAYSANLFSDLFDASTVLNSQRGVVPSE